MNLGGIEYEVLGSRMITITHIFLKDSNPHKNIVGHGGTHLYVGSKRETNNDPAKFFDTIGHDSNDKTENSIINFHDLGEEYRDETTFFTIYVYDGILDGVEDYRFYLKSEGIVWSKLRETLNPDIHIFSVVKLRDVKTNKIFYYFKILVDKYADDLYIGDLDIEGEIKFSATEREVLQKVRIHQSTYRKALLKSFDQECVITGIKYAPILDASHIKPWKVSSDEEKLNPLNGLLMIGTCHKLFDLGLVGVNLDSNLLVSPFLPVEELTKINVKSGTHLKIPNLTDRMPYLDWHRNNIFQR